jgi:uncharacterized membrane protein HdeD (DUF308 family)
MTMFLLLAIVAALYFTGEPMASLVILTFYIGLRLILWQVRKG